MTENDTDVRDSDSEEKAPVLDDGDRPAHGAHFLGMPEDKEEN
jgi:hypothetical protein